MPIESNPMETENDFKMNNNIRFSSDEHTHERNIEMLNSMKYKHSDNLIEMKNNN